MKNYRFLIALLLLAFVACDRPTYPQGATLYTHNCANCHMEDGSGLRGTIPPLANSDYMRAHWSELPCIIQHGLTDSITVNGVLYTDQPMPANHDLTPVEIANLMNYLQHQWGDKKTFVQTDQVEKQLESCAH